MEIGNFLYFFYSLCNGGLPNSGSNGNGQLSVVGNFSQPVSKGLNFREVLAYLVLITRGTREEKIKCKNYSRLSLRTVRRFISESTSKIWNLRCRTSMYIARFSFKLKLVVETENWMSVSLEFRSLFFRILVNFELIWRCWQKTQGNNQDQFWFKNS